MRIRGENLSFAFRTPGTERSIFEGLSFDWGGESPLVILGPSGCGKTTLLRLLAGLLVPSEGILAGIPEEKSFVFQDPRLLPWLSVLDNVMLPIRRRRGARERALRFLELTGLADKAAAFPGELSGGQRQRASIARAFAVPAALVLMDEPFQSLDIPLRIKLMDLTLDLVEEGNCFLAAVSHDPREAAYLGSRIVVLGNGDTTAKIVFDEPNTLSRAERNYGAAEAGKLERRLISFISG